MKLALWPIDPNADMGLLVDELAPAFGGDEEAARELMTQTIGILTAEPRPHPWGAYIARDGGNAVGTCAFKTAPDDTGVVEIAYMTFPAQERRGYAAAMAGELVDMALAAEASVVIAHTLPEENPSNRALLRNGFRYVGEATDPEEGLVWRWERPR